MSSTTKDDLIGYVERAMAGMTLHETIREHVENGGITGYDFTYHEDTHTWTDDDDVPMHGLYIPNDHPARPLWTPEERAGATDLTTCGTCGTSWDDDISTSCTPVPSGRCPYEAYHDHDHEPQHHDADDMREYMQDDPAQLWLDGALEVRVHGYRSLYGDDFTWTHVSALLTFGGPNIWADWDGSRWHFHGHWGGEEVHRYMGEDDMGVGSYLSDYAERGY